MAEESYDFRQLVTQLSTAHIRGYLLGQGWEEQPSRYEDHLYFQGSYHSEGNRYELYLPTATRSPRYQGHVMRAIYKLCGIEDREPQEIARDMLARPVAAPPVEELPGVARLRVRNTDRESLRLRIDSPAREHDLLPGEAVELVCEIGDGAMLEIERGECTLVVRTFVAN
jgi:hypothetical protein